MASTFEERMDELVATVGIGELQGVVECDQIYAHYQHEDLTLKHTHGGQGRFLSTALYARMNESYQTLADHVLDGTLGIEMVRVTEEIAGAAEAITPILPEAPLLRRSYSTTVNDHGVPVYHQPPEVPRLTQHEITKIHEAVGPAAHDD